MLLSFVRMSTNKVTWTNKKVHNEWTPELQHVGQTERDMWVWSAAATIPVRLPMTTCLFIGKGQVTPCTRVCFHVFAKQPGIFTTYVCFLCSCTGRCRFSSWGGRGKSLSFTNRQNSGGERRRTGESMPNCNLYCEWCWIKENKQLTGWERWMRSCASVALRLTQYTFDVRFSSCCTWTFHAQPSFHSW